ncbi:MAG: hypothetical protein IKR39_02015 [Lachnospiraceae bacterium]|nr:hypothetical protein [Lachnospiraceae bacterium]
MKLSPNCFVDEDIKHPDKVIDKLNRGKLIKGYYLVNFNDNTKRLEIISSRMFLQKYFREQEYDVKALLKTQDDAFEYVRCISEISYRKYNEFDALKTIENTVQAEIKAQFYGENE